MPLTGALLQIYSVTLLLYINVRIMTLEIKPYGP